VLLSKTRRFAAYPDGYRFARKASASSKVLLSMQSSGLIEARRRDGGRRAEVLVPN
jgi:hypothetical protein